MTANQDFIAPENPITLFENWFAQAQRHEVNDPNAMALATVGADMMPSVRIVLLKDHSEKGFTFFTNQQSRKGEQLAATPKAGLNFHWKSLRRQVRLEGAVELVGQADANAYFVTRPRGSQIGAWASQQSRLLNSRSELEQKVTEIEKLYDGKPVPRPPHWGGYCLVPTLIEFWQDREFRLHDRIIYRRDKMCSPWQQERLYP